MAQNEFYKSMHWVFLIFCMKLQQLKGWKLGTTYFDDIVVFLCETILISLELKFRWVKPFSYKNWLWNKIFWKELFYNQLLASRKEGYSIVDWETSPLAISIVGPMSCFTFCFWFVTYELVISRAYIQNMILEIYSKHPQVLYQLEGISLLFRLY